jgi:hypothetical protein
VGYASNTDLLGEFKGLSAWNNATLVSDAGRRMVRPGISLHRFEYRWESTGRR